MYVYYLFLFVEHKGELLCMTDDRFYSSFAWALVSLLDWMSETVDCSKHVRTDFRESVYSMHVSPLQFIVIVLEMLHKRESVVWILAWCQHYTSINNVCFGLQNCPLGTCKSSSLAEQHGWLAAKHWLYRSVWNPADYGRSVTPWWREGYIISLTILLFSIVTSRCFSIIQHWK